MFLTFILIFIVIIFFEAIPFRKKKLWKELTAIITLTAISICFTIFKLFDILTPIVTLKDLVYPFGRMVFRNH